MYTICVYIIHIHYMYIYAIYVCNIHTGPEPDYNIQRKMGNPAELNF